MKKFIQNILASLARKIIQKYRPRIIGITGSVGKTSAREAVFFVMNQKYKTYRPNRNLNNELGLPLAIIGFNSPDRSILGWLEACLKALGLVLIKQNYPEVLVLEYGIDRAGDMDYLLSIARPHISIITSIGISHLEFLKDETVIESEKGKLAEVLEKDDVLIVNADNPKALAQRSKTRGQVLSYGMDGLADIALLDIREKLDGNIKTVFTAKTSRRIFEATINAVGKTHLSAAASAVAVGEALKIETDLIIKGLLEYKPAPGRLNIIAGIKHSIIIDDTYNAAPDSMKEALTLLHRFPASYKIAVLGDMLELGSVSDEAHQQVGQMVTGLGIQRLITVGPNAKIIADAAIAAEFPESQIAIFDNSDTARVFVQNILEPDSLILIKGSQGVRLEKITKEIMAEPMRASELLCRQYGNWLL